MDNTNNMHPQTVNEARSAALKFEYQGENAMSAYGDQRAQLVASMQTELQGMTPDERTKFYQNYDTGSTANENAGWASGAMSMPRSYSSPNGAVERNSAGEPTGIVFKESALDSLWNTIMRRNSDEIHIKG